MIQYVTVGCEGFECFIFACMNLEYQALGQQSHAVANAPVQRSAMTVAQVICLFSQLELG